MVKELLKVAYCVAVGDAKLEHKTELYRFAHRAYDSCVLWFGSPRDADWPFRIVPSHRSLCAPMRFEQYYALLIKRSPYIEAMCLRIGHEMYHRVTMQRTGLREQSWVDEMMAELTGYQLLYLQGMREYAIAMESTWQEKKPEGPVDVAAIQQARLPKRVVGIFTKSSDAALMSFPATVINLGMALRSVVGWEYLCSIVTAESLSSWIASLPEIQEYSVSQIFGLAPRKSQDLSLFSTKQCADLGIAYSWLNRVEEAVHCYDLALKRDPENTSIRHELVVLLGDSKQYERAIREQTEIVRLLQNNAPAHYSLGLCFQRNGEDDRALQEILLAIDLDPDLAVAHYSLGQIYVLRGERLRAKEYFHQAVRTGASWVVIEAQQELEKLDLSERN